MNEAIETSPKLADGSKPLTPQELFEKLDSMGIAHSTIAHEALFTVEQSSKVKQDLPGGHTKNLFLKDKKSSYFLVVAESHAELDLKHIHQLIGASGRVSFGTSDRLMEYLGVTPGSVTAFAPVNDHGNKVKVIIDKPLMAFEQINCHPLINEMTTTISREDLLRFLEASGHPATIIQLSQG